MDDHEASTGVEEDTHTGVNQAILSSIERLNENMAQLTEYLTRDDEPNDEEFEDETPGEIAETVSIQADLDRIAMANTTENDGEEEGDVLASYSSQLDLDIEHKGPKVSDEVAGVVNKLRLSRVSVEQCKTLIKRHKTPENVKLRLPKCENSIWTQLPTRTRSTDAKLQATQQILLASINCQLEVTNKLFKSNKFPRR